MTLSTDLSLSLVPFDLEADGLMDLDAIRVEKAVARLA